MTLHQRCKTPAVVVHTLLVTGGGGFVMSNVVKAWLDPASDAGPAAISRRCVVLDLGVVRDAAFSMFLGPFVADGRLE